MLVYPSCKWPSRIPSSGILTNRVCLKGHASELRHSSAWCIPCCLCAVLVLIMPPSSHSPSRFPFYSAVVFPFSHCCLYFAPVFSMPPSAHIRFPFCSATVFVLSHSVQLSNHFTLWLAAIDFIHSICLSICVSRPSAFPGFCPQWGDVAQCAHSVAPC